MKPAETLDSGWKSLYRVGGACPCDHLRPHSHSVGGCACSEEEWRLGPYSALSYLAPCWGGFFPPGFGVPAGIIDTRIKHS
jgi:hypothetical protein